MSKFTAGPWGRIDDNLGCKNIYALEQGENGGIFAVAEIGYTHGVEESEDEANARLIAAAPDMLDALHHAENELIRLKASVAQLAPIRAAIKKATV